MGNKNLHDAKKNKNDEFYTLLSDVEEELYHYRKHFKGKSVLCNCDDPITSAFWKYFHLNFGLLGLTKLVSTHYEQDKFSYKMTYTGGNDNDVNVGTQEFLSGNGDFRSEECIELLKEADIVVTNPPFSLFRVYIAQLMEYDKKFIIWGNINNVTYKEVFPLIKQGKVWAGYMFNSTCVFRLPSSCVKWDEKITLEKNDGFKYGKVPSIAVFTNLAIKKRQEKLILWETYDPKKFPKYDNYDAIDIGKTNKKGKRVGDINLIPKDYYGVMGVPITFIDKYNPEQFEILGITQRNDDPFKTKYYTTDEYKNANDLNARGVIIENGIPQSMYARILIKRR